MENAARNPLEPAPSTFSAASPAETERSRLGAPQTPQIVIQQVGAGKLARLLSSIGWLGFAICGFLLIGMFVTLGDYFDTTEGITEEYHSLAKFGRDKVAVISLTGVIMTGEGFVKQQIDRVRQDEQVKAVVLRVDSPGGTVTGADYIYHHLKKLREERKLPLVVSMGSVAASGGYYVAMSVGNEPRSIYAEPTTTTGSIGVVIPHYDISGLLARLDVKDDSLATHPRKEMLSMTKPMTDDQRQLLGAYLDEAFQRFKSIVKEGRPKLHKDPGVLEQLATGEIFTAQQAKQHGLVDEIGFLEDAIDRAIELAALDKDKTRVVRFQPPMSLWGMALGRSRSLEPQVTSVTSLLELATPRAWYLWTSLPLLTSHALAR